ncbi:MAG: HAMP domain-containing histidine kinase [Bacteroidales bacterium]|nr:HAMP domain-containing histidine kinase [Bacteroidales bacterium]
MRGENTLIEIRGKKINRFTLEFSDKSLERSFKSDYFYHSLFQNRLSIIFGMIVFLFFSIIDTYIIPELSIRFIITRVVVILPLGIAALLLSYTKRDILSNYFQTFSVLVIGFVINYFILTSSYVNLSPYYPGLILYFIYLFTVIRIYFIKSLLVSIGVLISFELTILSNNSLMKEDIITANLYVLSALLLSSIAGYFGELLMRKNYLVKNELEKANDEISQARLNLEDEIQKRTVELVNINKQLRKSKLRAEGSENLKTNFIANISHEIRTPLTRIIGFSELLTKAELSSDKRMKYSLILQENSDQLLRVITDMIELSKLQTDNVKIQNTKFNLAHFLESFNAIFSELNFKYSKNQIKFSIDNFIQDSKMQVYSDKNELRKVITNLLDNSVKFTNKGFVKLSCNVITEKFLMFCISDTGIGIDKENQEFIFDYFRQVDDGATRSYGGVGVGLSISKEIIRSLGGEIWVESDKNKGANFYFKIPYV